MLGALLTGALIVAASLVLGGSIMALAGRPRHSAVGPAAGLSALLVICGIAVKLPGHGLTAAVATGVSLAGGVAILVRIRSPLGTVRPGAIVAVLGAALVISIPFAASGRVGILGQGLVNDDMASHLLFTEWVDAREGPTPDLIEDGYPLGPHAIVVAAAKVTGADLIEGFAGLTGALAVLLALTAYGALPGVRERFRAPAAVLAAIPYLAAAYLAQGAFKEPMLALALLGFALALPALRGVWDGRQPTLASTLPDRGRGWLKGQAAASLPLGVIAAGVIYNYSFPGLAWLVAAGIAWSLILAWRERGDREGLELRDRWRWARPAIVVGVGLPVLAAIPELFRLASFTSFEAFSPEGTGPRVGFGNLRQPLNPLEALGVWPSTEFRITPRNATTPEIAFYLGGLLALAAFTWGLGRAIARREAALPAALTAAALVYLASLVAGTPYTQAKALAIAAPVFMLIALRGLLGAGALEGEEVDAEPEARWWPPARLRPFVRVGIPALTAAFAAAAALSALLPLRQSAVGPSHNPEVLMEMRSLVRGEDVLFLGRDNFISWELLGAEVYTPILNHYDTEETSALYRATPINGKFDWDNMPARGIDGSRGLGDFDWVLTTRADFNSQAPPEFSPVTESEDFVLWRRTGEEAPRHTLIEPLYPGATLDCTEPGNARLASLSGFASVLPVAPVIGRVWEPSPDITDSAGASQELLLRPGRWKLSMHFAATQALRVSAPEARLDRTLRANLLFRGPSPYYPVGTLDVPGRPGDPPVAVTVDAAVKEPPLIGRLLGTESRAYLGTLAATPMAWSEGGPTNPGRTLPEPSNAEGETTAGRELGGAREWVPLRAACGRYVDWYTVAQGRASPALAGVEAPTVRPPAEE